MSQTNTVTDILRPAIITFVMFDLKDTAVFMCILLGILLGN